MNGKRQEHELKSGVGVDAGLPKQHQEYKGVHDPDGEVRCDRSRGEQHADHPGDEPQYL